MKTVTPSIDPMYAPAETRMVMGTYNEELETFGAATIVIRPKFDYTCSSCPYPHDPAFKCQAGK